MTIIAELGINHHGDFEKMLRMCRKAHEAGASYIKSQYYNPYKVLGKDHPELQYALQCQFTRKQHEEIAKYCESIGAKYFVSVFNVGDIPWADYFCPVHKIASRMNKNPEFISKIDDCKKMTFMSIQPEQGVRVPDRFKLMWCVREYPTCLEDVKKYTYNNSFGLSSHCPNPEALIYAAKKGAQVIEAHVCESRSEVGCDIASSLTFEELSNVTKEVRLMGTSDVRSPSLQKMR